MLLSKNQIAFHNLHLQPFVDLKLDDSKTVFTMDQFLSNLPYQDLTGDNTEQTELENMTAQAKVYQEVINENLDNPLI